MVLQSFLLIFTFLLFACSSTPPVCPVEKARDMGFSMALHSQNLDTDFIGKQCLDEEKKSVFRTTFEGGYEEGKKKLCNAEPLFVLGKSEGAEGRRTFFDDPKYHICENFHEMKLTLEKGVTLGLESFCQEDAAESKGREMAEKGKERDLSETAYEVCGEKAFPRFKKAFGRGYEKGLITFCNPDSIKQSAYESGSRGTDQTDLGAKFSACPATKQRELKTVFAAEYDKGLLSEYCTTAKIEETARKKAQESSTPSFPDDFQKCVNKSPKFKNEYLQAFAEERKRVVTVRCSYQDGFVNGQSDAERSPGNVDAKKTDMPDFCDTSLFGSYLSGYQDGWKTTKANQSTQPRQPSVKSDQPLSYPAERARALCNQHGYGEFNCRDVTSIVCIEMRYRPIECQIDSDYMVAVDACLKRGFRPWECQGVKNASCIESPNAVPTNCESAPATN
jgi:hypothetical protein